MTATSRSGASASAVRYALVVLLLTLAGLLGTTVPHAIAPDAATSVPVTTTVATVNEHQPAVTAGDSVIAAVGDHPDHGVEAIGLLCLCALLVTGILLRAPGASAYRVGLRTMTMAFAGNRPVRAGVFVHTVSRDPVLWGVSRT